MKRFTTIPVAAAMLLVSAGLGQGQEVTPVPAVTGEVVWILNSLLFLIGGVLVFFMAAGFAMLEGGLVRSRNVTMQMTKNVALFSLAAIMYWLVGYNLMYPCDDCWAIEGYLSGLFPSWGVLEPVGVTLAEADDPAYASTGSDFIFQLMFCAATASIVSGALAERIKLWPFLIFVCVLTGFIYPLTASWLWGGGWLDRAGFSDFAGSTVVHACGAAAALAGAIVLGPRMGKYKDGRINPMPGSNLPLATLGMFILWFGWFGFNGGSQLAMGSAGDVANISRIFANTNMAAVAGAVAVLILTQLIYGKPDLTMILNGALAGLVSITADPLAPSLGLALIIGAIGGVIVVITVPMLDRMRIDDVVGAIPVHGCAGIWGTFAVVLTGGHHGGATLGAQILGMVAIIGTALVLSLVVWYTLKFTMGIRVSEDAELAGLDISELGMESYPEFAKG
ncbi:MAG: ammonium transporter [Rhodobacteraceae bacterium]|nr:ammonium transporter [Paracoccaceae bacterium]